MRLVYVNADCGIPVFGSKGASVHIQEMVRAFTAIGCEARLVTARLGSAPGDDLAALTETVPGPERSGTLTARDEKERHYLATAEHIEARLLDLYRTWPFDLIYERYSLWSAAGVRTARLLGLPCVVEVNAPLVEEQAAFRRLALEEAAKQIEAEVLAGADALTVVSAPLAAYVVDRGADPDRVRVTANAVDLGRFHPGVAPAAVPGIPDNAFVVGFVGSLKRWHGVDVLLEAFRRVKAVRADAHLLVVGDGPKRGWIEGFVQGAQLTDAVTLTGWVDHGELPGLIARMDVATAPYPQSDNHYFSPLKLFEYVAAGRPIVASAIGQTADVVTDGHTGMLVPPGDAAALADALIALHADPQLAARLAAGAADQGRRYDWKSNARAVLEMANGVRRAA